MKNNVRCLLINKKKTVLFCLLIFIILLNSTIVYGVDLKKGKYNQKYEEWLKLSDEEKNKTIPPLPININIYNNSEQNVPSTLNSKFKKSLQKSINGKFDLRDLINLEVKNQYSTMECWAFAANSAVESYLSLNNKNYNFSERHLDYATSKSFFEGPLEDSLDRYVRDGGYIGTAFTYYSRGSGPVLEEDMPFKNHENFISQSEMPVDRTIQKVDNMVYFPQLYKNSPGQCTDANGNQYSLQDVQKIRTSIKEHIMQNGGVVTSIYSPSDKNFYNTETHSAYLWDNEYRPNHDVLIIGWDDSYSKNNFLRKPSNDGAYIVLNSFGTEFGENGVYYVSYEDCYIEANTRGIIGVSDINYDNIYQHDTSEMYNYIQVKYAANVFSSQNNETLTEIMIGSLAEQNCNIYINNSGDNLDISKLQKIESNVKLSPGYNSIKLSSSVELEKGKKFAVIIELLDNYSGIGVEDSRSPYARVTSNRGESFASFDGSNWMDIYNENNMMNFSIKVFTKAKEQTGKIKNLKIANKNIIEGLGGKAEVYLKTTTLLEGAKPIIKIFNEGSSEVTNSFTIENPDISKTLSKIKINIPSTIAAGKYTIKVFINNVEIDQSDFTVLSSNVITDDFKTIRFKDVNLFEALKQENVLTGDIVLAYFDETQEIIMKNNITELNLHGNYVFPNGFLMMGSGYNIKELDGIENLQNLNLLDVSSNYITSLNPISNLTNLQVLSLFNNRGIIKNLENLKNLKNLYKIELTCCGLNNISALSNLTNLKILDLQYNSISDISPIANLTNLEYLCLDHNQIENINGLKNLTNLHNLYIQDNILKDISCLNNLVNLQRLYLSSNSIEDISVTENFTQLSELLIPDNKISDIKFLKNCKNLNELNMNYNNISDISVIPNLTLLFKLEAGANKISDISPLKNCDSLNHLELSYNNIFDISALNNLNKLNYLGVNYQSIEIKYDDPNNIELPQLFKECFNPDSKVYSSVGGGVSFLNCSWNEVNKSLKLDNEQQEGELEILDGKAKGSILKINKSPENLLSFNDVSKSDWFYNTVKWAYNNNVVKGYNDKTFAPNDKTTRGQLVTILWRIAGTPNTSNLKNEFIDVPEKYYYTEAIKWAYSKGIIKGYEGTAKFGPEDPIIRQDLLVILMRYANYKEKDTSKRASLDNFTDYKKVNTYAENSVKWAVAEDIIKGNDLPNGTKTLAPQSNATRAETVTMLMRFCEKYNII